MIVLWMLSVIVFAVLGYLIGRSTKSDKIAREKGYRDFEQIPRHKYPPFVEPNGLIIGSGGGATTYGAWQIRQKWPNGIPQDVQRKMIADMKSKKASQEV